MPYPAAARRNLTVATVETSAATIPVLDTILIMLVLEEPARPNPNIALRTAGAAVVVVVVGPVVVVVVVVGADVVVVVVVAGPEVVVVVVVGLITTVAAIV